MSNPFRRYGLWAAVLAVVVPASAVAQTPNIVLDYSKDTNNFFGVPGSPQRVALQAAATKLQSRLTDTLTAITPGGGNSWTATFFDPANLNGPNIQVSNLSLATGELRVFAGGQVLGGSTLGVGGPGGWSAGGSSAFLNTVAARGQAGALAATPTDFGPWGGSITFDTATSWNFNVAAGPAGGQVDFLSVAEHELGHLLGFGTAGSFDALSSGTAFNGPKSNALVPGVQVTADHGHWAPGTSYLGHESAMTPSITVGTRKEFNELDYAGLDDLGWDLTPVPEPATVFVVAVVGLAGAWAARRRTAGPR